MLQVAERYFSATEVAELKTLEGEAQLRRYFHFWTRREAYGKATGKGLDSLGDIFGDVLAGSGALPHAVINIGLLSEETAWSFLGIRTEHLLGSVALSVPPSENKAYAVTLNDRNHFGICVVPWPADSSI